MQIFKPRHKIIIFAQSAGFLLILAITWLDEGVLLPHHLLGNWFGPGSRHEAILESIAITVVGLTVLAVTRQLLNRVYYLESFLRVCSWCRKLDLNGHWVPMEEYLHKSASISCTHGICEDCAINMSKEAAAQHVIMPMHENSGTHPSCDIAARAAQQESSATKST